MPLFLRPQLASSSSLALVRIGQHKPFVGPRSLGMHQERLPTSQLQLPVHCASVGLIHPSQRAHLLEFAPVTPSLTSLRPLFFFLLDFSRPRRFAPSSPILAPPSSHLHHSTQSHRLHDGILGSHCSFVCGGRALRRKSTHWALCFDQCSPNLKCK